MNPSHDDRPKSVIEEAWRQYKAWAAAAREEKRKQDQARAWTLWLGIIGALLAAAAGLVSGLESATVASLTDACAWFDKDATASVLSALSALVIAAAGFLGKELLTPERENLWTKCRIIAEALKRQVWLALMRVPPYDKPNAAARLAEIIEQLSRIEDVTHPLPDPGAEVAPPQAETVDDYIAQRVQEQVNWYRDKAEALRKELLAWRQRSLELGILAIALSSLGAILAYLPAWVPVVTSASAAVFAIIQNGGLQTLPPLYQQTANQLSMTLAAWEDSGRTAMTEHEFVTLCEDIMAKENNSWRMEQFSRQADADDEAEQDETAGDEARNNTGA